MANLIVRNISDEIALALKAHARQRGLSAEAAHRQILERVLKRPKRKTFADVLKTIPDVGMDEDFERHQNESVRDIF